MTDEQIDYLKQMLDNPLVNVFFFEDGLMQSIIKFQADWKYDRTNDAEEPEPVVWTGPNTCHALWSCETSNFRFFFPMNAEWPKD